MSDYFSEILKADSEALTADGEYEPTPRETNLVPEEQDLAEALIEIADKYGKFNEDQTGIWADYHEPEDNPYAEMGVKCSNCVLYRGGEECAVVAFKVHPEGYCRFAVLPDGTVDPSKAPEGTKPYEDHEVFSNTYMISQEDLELSADGPCWDGYKQVGMKEKDGKMVPNCVPDNEASLTATSGSKPAPKKDQIKGSSKNAKGSAASGKGVTFSASVIKALEKKVAEHNEKAPAGRRVTLAKLKAVYRRGAGAFSTSHRPDQNRNSWAMARVNAFLKLVRSGKPNNPKYTTDNDLLPRLHPRHSEASTLDPLMASIVAALNDDSCPPATQDIAVNLANREKAIETAGYGPLNPQEPNEEFWAEKANRWSVDVAEAKKSVCGNCVMFIRTPKMLDCIESGITAGDSSEQNAWDAIDTAELGYCEAFDFKCAASRTCSAWVVGGPITEENNEAEVASGGYGATPPALKQGDIKAPSKGPELETTMSKNKKIRYSRNAELALRKKLVEHNARADYDTFATLDMFKAVYRRGAGAFAASGKPDQERHDWAMARVSAFSHLLKSGQPKNSSYTLDNDLLPPTHPKSTMSTESLTASGLPSYDEILTVSILSEDEYESQEHAVYALAEYSGLGYETIPAIRAAWIRGIKNNENPFERAAVLASALYDSPDADLLPKKGTL